MDVLTLALHTVGSIGLTLGICAILLLCIWRMLYTLQQGASYVRRLHQIPCSRCVYFTGDYRLKCAVHPISALTEEAIDCFDYVKSTPPCSSVCSQNTPSYQNFKKLVKQ